MLEGGDTHKKSPSRDLRRRLVRQKVVELKRIKNNKTKKLKEEEEEEDSWYYKGAEAVRLFDLAETWDFYSDILSPRRGAAKRIKK